MFARFAGLLLAVIGAAQLLGAMGGGSDPLQPLAGLTGARADAHVLAFRTIKSNQQLDRELAALGDLVVGPAAGILDVAKKHGFNIKGEHLQEELQRRFKIKKGKTQPDADGPMTCFCFSETPGF